MQTRNTHRIKHSPEKISDFWQLRSEGYICVSKVVRVQAPETTKQCPRCGNTHLILLRTLNKKSCTDCDTDIVWNLEHGQKPLV